jgi:hypothetical protein
MRGNIGNRLRRLRAAMIVVAYALGVLTPTVAFARADRDAIVHVLSESPGGMITVHFHDDDGDRHDHPVKPGAGPSHHCCGVVSLPGLEPSPAVAILPPQTTTAVLPTSEPLLSGRVAARLERPPKSLLTA